MESNTWCPRLTAAIILSGSAVQVKVWDQDFSATMAPLICWSFSSSMFKYRLVDHAVPAMWRSLAAARLRAGCASGNAPTTRVRRLTLQRTRHAYAGRCDPERAPPDGGGQQA